MAFKPLTDGAIKAAKTTERFTMPRSEGGEYGITMDGVSKGDGTSAAQLAKTVGEKTVNVKVSLPDMGELTKRGRNWKGAEGKQFAPSVLHYGKQSAAQKPSAGSNGKAGPVNRLTEAGV